MDENSILGTSGKDALPFEYQAQEQAIARKRMMAQMMLQKSQAASEPLQNFGGHLARRSPFEHVNKAIQMYLGQKAMADADAEKTGVIQQAAEDQKGQIAKFMSLQQGQPIMGEGARPEPMMEGPMPGQQVGVGQPDMKGAIAHALSSGFPSIQGMGQKLQTQEWQNQSQRAGFAHADQLQQGKFGQEKIMQENKQIFDADQTEVKNAFDQRMKIGQLYNNDPQLAASLMQKGLAPGQQAPAMEQAAPVFGRGPDGSGYSFIPNKNGGAGAFNWTPKETRVSTSVTNVGAKTDGYMDKLSADRIAEGTKAHEGTASAMAQLNRLNDNINKGADQGAGADVRQSLRQFGEAFGVATPKGGLTASNQMIYGEQLLKAVKAVAPVSEKETPMVAKLIGSASTNPRAMKELIAWSKAKMAIAADTHNTQVEQASMASSGTKNKYDQFKVPVLPLSSGDKANDARTKQFIRDSGGDVKRYNNLPDGPDVNYFDDKTSPFPAGSPASQANIRRKDEVPATPPAGIKRRNF